MVRGPCHFSIIIRGEIAGNIENIKNCAIAALREAARGEGDSVNTDVESAV